MANPLSYVNTGALANAVASGNTSPAALAAAALTPQPVAFQPAPAAPAAPAPVAFQPAASGGILARLGSIWASTMGKVAIVGVAAIAGLFLVRLLKRRK